MTNAKALAQIRKLIDLGEDDGATEAEAGNALRFASRLMLKHRISEAELHAAADVHEVAADTEYTRMEVSSSGVRLSRWESDLSMAMCKLIGTVQCYIGEQSVRRVAGVVQIDEKTGEPNKSTPILFYGPLQDVVEAQELFLTWAQTIAAMARLRYGGVFRGPGRSYCEGFSRALYGKAQSIVREQMELLVEGDVTKLLGDVDTTALVLRKAHDLVRARLDHGKTWLAEEHDIRLQSRGGGNGGKYYGDAHRSGSADGRRSDLSRTGGVRRLT